MLDLERSLNTRKKKWTTTDDLNESYYPEINKIISDFDRLVKGNITSMQEDWIELMTQAICKLLTIY